MRRVITGCFAALLFIGGKCMAEPRGGGADPANYRTYMSTSPGGGTARMSHSAFLHKIIVSSPTGADFSTMSVVDIYNASGTASNLMASVQTSTNEITGLNEWTFDMYLSSGFTIGLSTGNGNLSDQAGSVQAIFNPGGVQADYNVWTTSFMTVDTASHVIRSAGPVYLHKISVLRKQRGAGALALYNFNGTGFAAKNKFAAFDLTATPAEYTFETYLSSGLVLQANGIGTTAGQIMLFYKIDAPRDFENWQSTGVTGAVTTISILAGRGVFGGVMVTSATATASMTIYNSNGVASNPIAVISGSVQSDRHMYDINVSSGLTITSVGSAKYTVFYRRSR